MHAAIGRFGHRLEWVVEYRSAEDLMDVDGVWLADRTCQMLDKALAFEFEDRGGILHAVHGLRMYAAKISTGRTTAGRNALP